MHIAGFLNHLLEASVGAAILVPLVLLLRRFGRARVGSRAVYLAWLLVAVRLLLPISLPNPLLEADPVPAMRTAYEARIEPVQTLAQTDAGQLPDETSRAETMQQSVREQEVQPAPAGQPVGEPAPSAPPSAPVWGALQWTRAIFGAYLLGAAMTAAYMVVVNVRFRRRVRRAEAGAFDPLARAQYDALCAQLGVKPLPVVLCDPLPGACLVGVARSRIALPLALRGEDLRLTLLHELSHAKSHDGLWGLIRSACCVLFWFHPLVWLGAHLSRLDGEMACDERVTDKLSQVERIAYAEMLVRAAARRGAPSLSVLATGMSMNGSRMKARVRSIVQSRAVRRSALAAAALVGAAMLTLTFATAEVERPMMNGIPIDTPEMDLRRAMARDFLREAYGIEDPGDLANVVPSPYNDYVQIDGNLPDSDAAFSVVVGPEDIAGVEMSETQRPAWIEPEVAQKMSVGEIAHRFVERFCEMNGSQVSYTAEGPVSWGEGYFAHVCLTNAQLLYEFYLYPDGRVVSVKPLDLDCIPRNGVFPVVERLPRDAACFAAEIFLRDAGFAADEVTSDPHYESTRWMIYYEDAVVEITSEGDKIHGKILSPEERVIDEPLYMNWDHTVRRSGEAQPAPAAVDWPPSEVPPQTLDALGLPIAGLRLTSQACEMDWLEPVSGWQIRWYDAQGEQITSQSGAGVMRHTTPYGKSAPWTLEFSREGHSPLHTLVLDEDGKILTYAYGGYPDDVVLGTEQAMPPRKTFNAEREVDARIRQILPDVDGGATGSAYAEVRRDAGRIRKYVQTERGETYYFTAATDGSRILSMRWGNGKPQHYMDLTIAPTREEATAHAQAILTDIAGWLPEEVHTPSLTVVDRPSRGERYSYEFYGASRTDAKDIWYGIYIGGHRHLDAFWRMDVLEDAPAQRTLTEAERTDLAEYACAFVEETRGMYSILGLEAAVEEQAQVYDFGEVARVNVDDAEGGRDLLYIRLEPRSVLYQNRADVASAASGDARQEAEGEWEQAQALLDAVGNEARIYTAQDRGGDTRFQGGEGKERFTLVMGEDGSLISYALKRLEDEPIGTQKLPEAQRRSLEAHANAVGEQLLGQAQVSVEPEAAAYKWGVAAKARVWDAQSGQGYDLVLGLEPMRVLGLERRAQAAE